MKTYNHLYPIVVGITGKAGSGKTSTADTIVPRSNAAANFEPPKLVGSDPVNIAYESNINSNQEIYDHLYFAMPLYKMVSTIRGIDGDYRKDRIKYCIHDILTEVFTHSPLYGAPKYDDLIGLVNEISNMHVPEDGKARNFMQDVGSMMRSFKQDCFVSWARSKTLSLFKDHLMSEQKTYTEKIVSAFEDGELNESIVHNPRPFVVIWSDVRFPNEAEFITKQPNGILIRLDASWETRKQRIIERDGHLSSADEERLSHESEKSVDLIPNEWFDNIINTEEITLAKQSWTVIETVKNFIEGA